MVDRMRSVAVIDDADDNRDLVYYLLRDEFAVSQHSHGLPALAEFAANPPDLIVLDIRLPDIDGIEVLNRVRGNQQLRQIPIIALTANAMSGDRERYLAAGFNEYIAKPIVDLDHFVATIRRFVRADSEA